MATGLGQQLHRRVLVTSVLLAWHATACAQPLVDPTRPAVASTADPHQQATKTAVLQSIIIMPHQRLAIISGERVTEGSQYGDAQVVEIMQDRVVLRSATRTETLQLHPQIELKPTAGTTQVREKPTRERN